MRINYVVIGYVCLATLFAFDNKEHLIPQWIRAILWMGTFGCFSVLAFKQNPNAPQKRLYHNSPVKPISGKILGSVEISRGFCRERFEMVTEWKKANPYRSWDHVEAVAVFAEFSTDLDRHLDEFKDEKDHPEVRRWIDFADEIRRNRD